MGQLQQQHQTTVLECHDDDDNPDRSVRENCSSSGSRTGWLSRSKRRKTKCSISQRDQELNTTTTFSPRSSSNSYCCLSCCYTVVSGFYKRVGRCMFVACFPVLHCFGLEECRHRHQPKHFSWNSIGHTLPRLFFFLCVKNILDSETKLSVIRVQILHIFFFYHNPLRLNFLCWNFLCWNLSASGLLFSFLARSIDRLFGFAVD